MAGRDQLNLDQAIARTASAGTLVRNEAVSVFLEVLRLAAEARALPDATAILLEEDGSVVLEASMPGVKPEDVELSCVDNVLTIKGQAHVPEREYLHQEIRGLEYARCISDLLSADRSAEPSSGSASAGGAPRAAVSGPACDPRAPRAGLPSREPDSASTEFQRVLPVPSTDWLARAARWWRWW